MASHQERQQLTEELMETREELEAVQVRRSLDRAADLELNYERTAFSQAREAELEAALAQGRARLESAHEAHVNELAELQAVCNNLEQQHSGPAARGGTRSETSDTHIDHNYPHSDNQTPPQINGIAKLAIKLKTKPLKSQKPPPISTPNHRTH